MRHKRRLSQTTVEIRHGWLIATHSFIWNWCSSICIEFVLWMLMAWCYRTMALTATMVSKIWLLLHAYPVAYWWRRWWLNVFTDLWFGKWVFVGLLWAYSFLWWSSGWIELYRWLSARLQYLKWSSLIPFAIINPWLLTDILQSRNNLGQISTIPCLVTTRLVLWLRHRLAQN